MAKYLFRANYIGDGVQGLRAEGGSKRRKAVEALFKSVGGRVESFHYAFGDADAYVIGEFPDHSAAAAAALAVNASGLAAVQTTVLLTPEEVDAAVKKSPKYRAPGK